MMVSFKRFLCLTVMVCELLISCSNEFVDTTALEDPNKHSLESVVSGDVAESKHPNHTGYTGDFSSEEAKNQSSTVEEESDVTPVLKEKDASLKAYVPASVYVFCTIGVFIFVHLFVLMCIKFLQRCYHGGRLPS